MKFFYRVSVKRIICLPIDIADKTQIEKINGQTENHFDFDFLQINGFSILKNLFLASQWTEKFYLQDSEIKRKIQWNKNLRAKFPIQIQPSQQHKLS